MLCPICDEHSPYDNFKCSSWDKEMLICKKCYKYEMLCDWNKVITKSKRLIETWPLWKKHVLKMKRKVEK